MHAQGDLIASVSHRHIAILQGSGYSTVTVNQTYSEPSQLNPGPTELGVTGGIALRTTGSGTGASLALSTLQVCHCR